MGSATANHGSVTAGNDVAASQDSSNDSLINFVPAPPQPPTWPAETDLLLLPGCNKVMLTVQRPTMHAVFQDTFERIRAAMVFQNAFPNIYDTIEMITDNLIRAAESIDRATNIHQRLLMDGDYTSNMSRLVSIQFSNTMLLIHFTASRTHSHFPRRGQGSMRYDCACRIPGPSFGIVGHSSCRKAAVELQLQLCKGI
jgi:hypothetical protein